jgi:hypothetical protein
MISQRQIPALLATVHPELRRLWRPMMIERVINANHHEIAPGEEFEEVQAISDFCEAWRQFPDPAVRARMLLILSKADVDEVLGEESIDNVIGVKRGETVLAAVAQALWRYAVGQLPDR